MDRTDSKIGARLAHGNRDSFSAMPSPESYIYVIYSAGLLKIGTTTDPVARFDGMRSMHSAPISLVWLAFGDSEMERDLHRRFRADRVKGEWFAPSAALREFLGGICDGWSMPPAERLAWAEANPGMALGF